MTFTLSVQSRKNLVHCSPTKTRREKMENGAEIGLHAGRPKATHKLRVTEPTRAETDARVACSRNETKKRTVRK
jgi:hypothetical protein